MRTGDILLHLDFLLHAIENLFQIQLHLHAKIGSPIDSPTALGTTEASKSTKSAKMATKDIAELREDILHRHASTAKTTRGSSSYAGMAELVVPCPFLFIAQHLVRLGRLFELFFSFFVTGIFIRVILNGFLPVSFLYLVGSSSFGYSQYFVKISLCCHFILPQLLLENG
ncbi:hypothetical protein SDC9_147042 [bioreactor metagenome]|uniref:Uncharacterized protein n=1 Tax=bioreactor metagenome TaxID=1076179 RepID=A0A645ECZ7_9ZZZZ